MMHLTLTVHFMLSSLRPLTARAQRHHTLKHTQTNPAPSPLVTTDEYGSSEDEKASAEEEDNEEEEASAEEVEAPRATKRQRTGNVAATVDGSESLAAARVEPLALLQANKGAASSTGTGQAGGVVAAPHDIKRRLRHAAEYETQQQ